MKSTFKQTIVSILRRTYLLQLADHLRYFWNVKTTKQKNLNFMQINPNLKLPPLDLAYDAYAHTNWEEYYNSGKQHAQYISTHIKKYIKNEKSLKICEWGCGPAKLLRHMPYFFADQSVEFYGFDYNSQSIKWCAENIKDITFQPNSLATPLLTSSDKFDCLYCMSVFTHLSKEMHFQWIKELSRVIKPNGILILTTHGDSSKVNLLKNEIKMYEEGQLVIRDKFKEGKRCFVAYHPPSFIEKKLLKNFTVISHSTEPITQDFKQDVWIVKNTEETTKC